jgi:hypothetical protein
MPVYTEPHCTIAPNNPKKQIPEKHIRLEINFTLSLAKIQLGIFSNLIQPLTWETSEAVNI